MITNADITLFNVHHVDKDTLRPVYLRTVIKSVNFFTHQEVQIGNNGGLLSADIYKIRIPEDADTEGKTYMDVEKWRALSETEAADYWTIDNGDLFGRGTQEAFDKESEFLKNPYTGKVVSFSDNRRGGLPHWRIGGAK